MPFIGKDWRAPGETWVRVSHTAGWERIKLRPVQLSPCCPNTSSISSIESITNPGATNSMEKFDDPLSCSLPNSTAKGLPLAAQAFKRHSSSVSLSSNDESCSSSSSSLMKRRDGSTTPAMRSSDSEDFGMDEEEEWIPHCFVKTTRSKEFIGCTSMSEAFHRLDLARAVEDVRRFNYICKVVQILVHEKLQNLSATARKHLFAIIQSIVIHSVEQDLHVSTARDLLNGFSTGLEEGHVCGSPQLVTRQLDTASGLVEMIVDRKPTTLSDSSEESLTFLDLPREVIAKILCKLPDHVSILETAKAHEALDALIDRETRLWRSLCEFHFTRPQIDKHWREDWSWRKVFFELKKFYGLREVYADLIHICCHCKALFWKDRGHPCVSKETAPSVRVTPRQFVDMLLFL